MPDTKESILVLEECAVLQKKKANDYQNPHSRIRQADYYPRGVATILDIIFAKVLRMYSVIEAMENDPTYVPNFESFEDSCKDLINYASFAAAYSRGKVDGQMPGKDFLNRTIQPQELIPLDFDKYEDFPDDVKKAFSQAVKPSEEILNLPVPEELVAPKELPSARKLTEFELMLAKYGKSLTEVGVGAVNGSKLG